MSLLCDNPVTARHEIADGARKITATNGIDWGADDIRTPWAGDYVFCSFACMSQWAAERGRDHDDVVLRNGVPLIVSEKAEAVALPVAVEPKL